MSVFFLITILLLTALWLNWRRRHEDRVKNPAVPFVDWRAATFDIWQGHLKGSKAATQVSLPIMAVSFGLTAIGIVLLLVESSAN